MRKLVFAALTALFLFAAGGRAFADDRIIYQLGEQLPPSWLNQDERNHRIEIGTILLHQGLAGMYANLSILPSTGLQVIVSPTLGNTYGAVYQLIADDTTTYGDVTTALAADPLQIVPPALMNSASAAIGPLAAPTGAGMQIDYLIEAKVTPGYDHNSLLTTFLDTQGNQTSRSVNQIRSDAIAFSAKASTPAINPTPPPADAGYVAIGSVAISTGQTTISSSNITMAVATAFNGFAALGTVSANTCAFFDAYKHLSSGGCNTAYGSPTTVTAGSSNVLVTQPSSANYTVDINRNLNLTSVQAGSAQWSGNSTIVSGGTATSSTNYGSAGTFQVQSSIWNGSSASTYSWGLGSGTQGNLNAYFGGTPTFVVQPSASPSSPPSSGGILANAATFNQLSVNGTATALGMSVASGSGGGGYTTLSNDQAASPATASGAFFGWNRSNGDGEADIYSLFNNSTTTARGISFHAYVGGTDTELGFIDRSGAYRPGSSKYGPTSATVNGTMTVGGVLNTAYEMFSGTSGAGGTSTWIAGNPTGMQLNVPPSDYFYFTANGTSVGQLNSAGLNIASGAYTGANSVYPLQAALAHPGSNQGLIGTDSSGYLTFRAYNGNGFQFQQDQGTPSTDATLNAAGLAVSSLISTAAGTSQNDFQWKCASAATNCDLGQNASATVNSVTGSVLTINNGTNSSAGAYATMDTSGTLGLGGALIAGSTLWTLNNGGLRVTFGTSTTASGDLVAGLAGAESVPYIGCSGAASNCTLYFYTNGNGSAYTAKIDGSGVMTASNFIVSSRREWKKNIVPYRFDPLTILGQIDYKEYDCRTPECGRTGMHKTGIIANDSPSQVSGEKHDHYDAFALAAIDGAAIVELRGQVQALVIAVCLLFIWCIVLTVVLAQRRA